MMAPALLTADELERLPPRAFARFAPDLAIEVLSPSDRPGEVLEKVADYLNAGTLLVWVIARSTPGASPSFRRTASVTGESDHLGGEDVMPGFSCTLAEVLD